MSKGLPRSLSRGSAQRQEIVKQSIAINETITFTGATGAVIFGTAPIGGLPEGNLLFLGAVAYLQLAGSGSDANLTADFQGDFGIGTAPTADNDLGDAGDDNIIPSTAIGPATAEVTPVTRGTSTEATEQGAILDNTDGSLELNLNILLDADEVTDGEESDITATGVVHLAFIVLGDD